MAKKDRRDFVWMECSSCGARNYRAERLMKDSTRLKLNKYCPVERKHTLHQETRKK